jgi:hypothetical protein
MASAGSRTITAGSELHRPRSTHCLSQPVCHGCYSAAQPGRLACQAHPGSVADADGTAHSDGTVHSGSTVHSGNTVHSGSTVHSGGTAYSGVAETSAIRRVRKSRSA